MKLNESEFKTLVQHLPFIEVSLDWDGTEGRAKIDGHEMKSGIYLVFADFTVLETGSVDSGDALTPSAFISNGLFSEINAVDCFTEDVDKSIEFTPEQKKLLFKAIQSKIQTV